MVYCSLKDPDNMAKFDSLQCYLSRSHMWPILGDGPPHSTPTIPGLWLKTNLYNVKTLYSHLPCVP